MSDTLLESFVSVVTMKSGRYRKHGEIKNNVIKFVLLFILHHNLGMKSIFLGLIYIFILVIDYVLNFNSYL